MTTSDYKHIEQHMQQLMSDSAHDQMHIYRVLYSALEIAGTEQGVDTDVLIAACLLHDIGRERQSHDLELDHALIGGEMAHEFLLSCGWDAQKAAHVKACVQSHRFRKASPPQTIEAKILFDADKLEAAGAIGIARTLIYGGQVTEPLYVLSQDGAICTEGGGAEISSFVQEFNYKLRHIYDKFYTERARAMAAGRKRAALGFYDSLLSEISRSHEIGSDQLYSLLQ